MSDHFPWLPALIRLADHGGSWESYEAELYDHFCNDFVHSKPTFRGVKLGLKRFPLSKGKEATYWHMVSEGNVEEDRTIDLKRCERIRWPRPGIDNSEETGVKVWETEVKGETRITIWLEAEDYVIILARRQSYILPWTAFVVDQEHRKRKLRAQYDAYMAAGA